MVDKEEMLMKVIESDIDDRDPMSQQTPASLEKTPDAEQGPRQWLRKVEDAFLCTPVQKVITKGNKQKDGHQSRKNPMQEHDTVDVEEVDIVQQLGNMKTCDTAFVVFDSEWSRNAAVDTTAKEGLKFKGAVLHLDRAFCEPRSVVWGNMHMGERERGLRLAIGLGIILLALALWAFAFYLPYAYYSLSFNYAHGAQPDAHASTTFTMVVIVGNVLMYFVCSTVSDAIRFRSVDSREVCYMLTYSIACIVNVVLDLVVSYYIALNVMTAKGTKSYHGKKLSDMQTFAQIFETYPMQRELGSTFLAYSWPSTFLIPFLMEPIFTIYVPFTIMKLIVRTNPKIFGISAATYLASAPLDLSRYADVLLNIMLAAFIFFFPGGYNTTMFFGLAVAHIWIYMFDHYRVIRVVPRIVISSMSVDWWAQWMLCIPCGLILACVVFKFNCDEHIEAAIESRIGKLSPYSRRAFVCDQSDEFLYSRMLVMFVSHILVHTLVLLFVVPIFGRSEKGASAEPYKDLAKRRPGSWFATNPVHCLRSQYIYGHAPPCDYCISGKEHLMRLNKEIGMYFSDEAAAEEEYRTWNNLLFFRRPPEDSEKEGNSD
eukprot:gnl/TRDRNA2_/TRDRNA2_174621_c3_seq13.p1 gnl/TRDRNA2_/TRDRNA2_174621_c3~~gnl/TRDRNA2_/TRDRNA2_174621_c3_seq13.p1  ORF type:complete len:654 (-),score=88.13 gnl/TRDRNA2_/TRDRNA2_174621_c3_seq13:65-1858(-)